MSYQAHFQLRDQYVRVEVTGTRRFGDAAFDAGEVGQEIVRFCREHDVYRVMVVLRLSGRLSAVDSYEMVVNSRSYGWTHVFRLAFVETNQDSAEDVKFTESVAATRAYAVKAFTEESSAVEWLMQDSQSGAP